MNFVKVLGGEKLGDYTDAKNAISSVARAVATFYAGELSETKMADLIAETFSIKNSEAKAALLAGHLELWDV